MPVTQELLNGGLVTARDVTLLQEGELSQADDCILRPRTPAVFKAPGRTRYGQPSGGAGAVKGLRHLAFDSNTDLLLGYVGTALLASPYTGATGTFTALPSAGAMPNDGTEFLDVIQYNNAFYTLQGSGQMRRVSWTNPASQTVITCTLAGNGTTLTTVTTAGFASVVVGQGISGVGGTGTIAANAVVTALNSTVSIEISPSTPGTVTTVTFSPSPFVYSRLAGMQAVSTFDATQVTTQTGTWNSSSNMGIGYYFFLYTEMVLPGKVDDPNTGFVESAFTGTIQSKNITNVLTQCIRVTHGNIVNSTANGLNAATHWQVYMSDRLIDANTKPSLSTFRRIGAPIPVSTPYFDFRDDVITVGPLTGTTTAPLPPRPTFTNPNGVLTPNDGTQANSAANDPGIAIRGFPFPSNGLTPVGVRVNITGITGIASAAAAYVRIRRQDGARTSTVDYRFEQTPASYGALLGSATDTWAPNIAWTADDFGAAVFEVWILKAGSGSVQNLIIDGVRVTVDYTGTSVNRNGVFYKTITLTSQVGVAISESGALAPPFASTADTFEGQMVANDLVKPALIRYSMPDQPEYWPGSYYINFESKKKDKITCIKRVGNLLIVGLQSSIKRVNYLPRETDAEFDRGRSQEDLTTDHGIVGPLAAAQVDLPGMGSVLAYVSYKGLHITDGITSREMNMDLDWANTVNLGLDGNGVPYLQQCMLENYASEYALRLAYVPAGGTTVTKYLQFSYHPVHMKNGMLPAMGPSNINARAYCTAVLGGVPKLLSGHPTDGYVYLEDNGDTSADVAALPAPTLRTRFLSPRGTGGQGRIQRVYCRVGAAGDATTGVFTLGVLRQNINESLALQATTYALDTVINTTRMAHLDAFAEGLVLKVSKASAQTAGFRLDYIAYQVEDGGMESHRS